MVKALFIDFDGTLYSHKTKQIPDSAYQAVVTAQKNGILVFLATGRSLLQLDKFDCRGLKFDGYVLNNGQLLLDKDCKQIWANYITGSIKQKLVRIYRNKELPLMLTTPSGLFINYVNEPTKKAFDIVDSEIPGTKEYDNEEILMATLFINDETSKNKINSLSNKLTITWWCADSADVISKNGSKLKGIKEMLKHYKISIKDTIGIGDSYNDIDMIKKCGIGIALGNSIKEVQNIADFVTSDIDEDGLYNALKKYELI